MERGKARQLPGGYRHSPIEMDVEFLLRGGSLDVYIYIGIGIG